MAKITPASDRAVTSGDNTLISPELLSISYAALEKRLAAFERKADQVQTIKTDDESGPWQEVIAEMDALGHDIESARGIVKEPFETAVSIANGFFFGMHAPRKGQTLGRLQIARDKIGEEILGYLNRKEAAERARRIEAARVAREQEEAALLKAEEERRKQQAAEEASRPKAASNAGVRAAVAEADASAAASRAFEAEALAEAKPADLARTRSTGGVLASTKVEWSFKIDDIDAVKGAPLWKYVPRAGKEAAIRAYIKANAPATMAIDAPDWQPLTGVTMIVKRGLQVRG